MLLWYLAELCGIYAVIPILAKIAHDEGLCKYYLAMWGVYNFIIRNVPTWLAYLGNPQISDIASLLSLFNAEEFLTYSGYLVLGYYLYYYHNKQIKGTVVLSALLASVMFPAIINQLIVERTGMPINSVYDYNGFSALFQTGCYILIAKQYLSKLNINKKCGQILSEISACTFGIYLIHPLFTGVLMYEIAGNILLKTPIITSLIFAVCCAIVAAIRWEKRALVDIWRTCSWKKRKYTIFLCTIWLSVLMITLYNCGLYGDGSGYVLSVINSGKLLPPEPFIQARGGVMVLTRIFIYMLMRLGVTSLSLLAYAYSFGCIFWMALLLTVSLYICYKYHSSDRILNHTIIIGSLILALSGLYCTHPSLTAVAIIWFIFICIYSWNEISRRYGWVACLMVVLLFCLFGTYEAFGVIGPAILLYYFMERIIKREKIGGKSSFIITALILVNSIYGAYWIQNPDNPAAKTGVISSILGQDWRLLTVLGCLAAFLFCVEAVFMVKNTQINLFFETVLSILLFIYLVCDPLRTALNCRSARNLSNFILPFLFVMYEVLLLVVPKRRAYASNLLAVSLSGACLAAVFGFGSGYDAYLKHLNIMADSAFGFVIWEPTEADNAYSSQWTVPNESILASMLFSDGDAIHGIVVQRQEDISFQPYDMWNIHAYYNLSKYGVIYDTDAFEEVLHREETQGKVYQVSFADGTNSARKYIAGGISTNEGGYTWTEGDCLKLKPVQIDNYSGEYIYTLTLNIGGVYQGPQKVVVSCSDLEVFRTSVPEMGGIITIPVQANEQGLIDIRIDLPDAVSPEEIEHTGDTRKLSLRLIEMTMAADQGIVQQMD